MSIKPFTLALAVLPLVAASVVTLAPTADAQGECRDFILDASVYVTAQYCVDAPPFVFVMACSEFAQDTVVTNTVNHVVGCRHVVLP